jgi:type II secretory pathway pseudopilin PulG
MRRAGGWSLIELMVALGLFGFVMLFVSMTLLSTSRMTQAQTSRSLRQATLQSSMRHLEKVLQRAPVLGVSWLQTTEGAILATHGLANGPMPATASAPTQPYWNCFLWDRQARTLSMGESQNAGGFPAPSSSRHQPMPSTQLQAILAGETPLVGNLLKGRRLADRVTDFVYRLESGPLYHLELELDIPPGDHAEPPDVQERQRAVLRLYPRHKV